MSLENKSGVIMGIITIATGSYLTGGKYPSLQTAEDTLAKHCANIPYGGKHQCLKDIESSIREKFNERLQKSGNKKQKEINKNPDTSGIPGVSIGENNTPVYTVENENNGNEGCPPENIIPCLANTPNIPSTAEIASNYPQSSMQNSNDTV